MRVKKEMEELTAKKDEEIGNIKKKLDFTLGELNDLKVTHNKLKTLQAMGSDEVTKQDPSEDSD